MKAALNKKQIDYISNHIKARGVSYTDVNMEMTDHIASEVEEVIAETGLEYMKAVKKVFLRYTRFHFIRIEEEQVKKLQKQSWKSFKYGFIEFFSFPKIVFTCCLYVAFVKISAIGAIEYVGYFYGVLICLMAIFIFVLKKKEIRKGNLFTIG